MDTARRSAGGILHELLSTTRSDESRPKATSPMRNEILISNEVELTAASSRVSMQRCLASISTTGKWFDAATKYEHAAINPTPLGGPGGTS